MHFKYKLQFMDMAGYKVIFQFGDMASIARIYCNALCKQLLPLCHCN